MKLGAGGLRSTRRDTPSHPSVSRRSLPADIKGWGRGTEENLSRWEKSKEWEGREKGIPLSERKTGEIG